MAVAVAVAMTDEDDELGLHAEALVAEAEGWEAEAEANWMGIKASGDTYTMRQPKTFWIPPLRTATAETLSRSAPQSQVRVAHPPCNLWK